MTTKAYALRCELEAREHETSCFVNLTYAPEHLPENGTLVKKHLQDFIKKLRARLDYHHDVKIRFFGAGEYGTKNGRPHYHVLIFGYDFPDKTYWRRSAKGFTLYRSSELEKVWTYGHAEIGEVSYLTAKYVAGYIRKKQTGKDAVEHYGDRIPEFQHASMNPGIGKPWYDKNKKWLWKDDQIVVNVQGRRIEARPPKYFEILFRKEDPDGYELWKHTVKAKRENTRRVSGIESVTHFEDDEEITETA